jgi:hypothetical protein
MALRRVPPAQRPVVAGLAVAVALAIAFVAYALLRASGEPAVRAGDYQPFVVGRASALGRAVQERPVFFADPTGGTRGFVLALEDDAFAALSVVPPGHDRACPIDWDPARRRFEDCRARAWETAELARFPVVLRDQGKDSVVVVDLRRRLPAPG